MWAIAFVLGVAFWAFVYSRTGRAGPTLLGAVIVAGLIAVVRYPEAENMAYRLSIPVPGLGLFFLKIAAGQAIWALLGIGAIKAYRYAAGK